MLTMKSFAVVVLIILCQSFYLCLCDQGLDLEMESGRATELRARRLRRRAQRKRLPTTRIVGGSPAGSAATFPFVASLYSVPNPEGFLPVCGGSLITPTVILTAAHCIFDIRSVQMGKYNYAAEETGILTFFNVERRFHPQFDVRTFDHDYALVKLGREHPDPHLVQLRNTSEIPETLTIMGWGLTKENGDQSDILLEGTVRRFNTSECRQRLEPDPVTENMFCAWEDGVDTCQGDSGGPIIIKDTNVQVGITSWGIGCASTTLPGVYARIDKGFSWIEETVCTDLDPNWCTQDGKLPVIGRDGKALEKTCDDIAEFMGHGKKAKTRNCDWVAARTDRRCQWYGEDYCPATCEVDRCQR